MSSITEDLQARRLQSIHKSIFHEILVYNQNAALHKQAMEKRVHDEEVRKYQELFNKEQQDILNEQREKKSALIRKRKMLQDQYERSMREKRERARREREVNNSYARIQSDYLDYKSERRIVDLERIYNRKTYEGRLVGWENNIKHSIKGRYSQENNLGSKQKIRFRTEPNTECFNPQQHWQENRYKNQGQSPQRDALDNFQIEQERNRFSSDYNNQGNQHPRAKYQQNSNLPRIERAVQF